MRSKVASWTSFEAVADVQPVLSTMHFFWTLPCDLHLNCAFCHGLKNDHGSPWLDLMTSDAFVTQNCKQPARRLMSQKYPESPG